MALRADLEPGSKIRVPYPDGNGETQFVTITLEQKRGSRTRVSIDSQSPNVVITRPAKSAIIDSDD